MKSPRKISLAKRIHSFGIFNIRKLPKFITKQKFTDRWHLSAEGFLLLPSALRPHLSKCILILLFLCVAAETFWLTDEVSAATLEITVPISYSIELNPGSNITFGESASQQVSVKTSGSFGYILNIKPDDGTDLKNGENLIKTITKIEGYDDSEVYKNSDEVNTWAYKPGKLNSLDNTKYLPFPSVETLLDKTITNNDAANTYDFTIASKIDSTLPSGIYSNSFVISATANTVSYSITYNLNSGTWNGTSPETGSTTESTINISSVTPTRSNYTFEGWCSTSVTNNSGSNPTCSGTKYSVGGSYTLTNGTNNLNLYAMWKQTTVSYSITYNSNGGSNVSSTTGTALPTDSIRLSSTTPTKSGYTFLGWCTSNPRTSETCSGTTYSAGGYYPLSNGTSITLYAIWQDNSKCNSGTGKRLKDGKCWKNTITNTTWYNASGQCSNPWRLPTRSDYDTLVRTYFPSASYDEYAGYSYSGSLTTFTNDWGWSSGYYWSSSTYSYDSSFGLGLMVFPSQIYSAYYYDKSQTWTVRCVSN